jgi:hypothetical protein
MRLALERSGLKQIAARVLQDPKVVLKWSLSRWPRDVLDRLRTRSRDEAVSGSPAGRG